jgi:CheY-like chemotaxis protein/HPt (histidine-containing phosphotransfer) domain-containing protein
VLLPDPDLAGVSVLVVDDNATSRRSLSRYLSDWGMAVLTADTAPSALAHLRKATKDGRPTAIALVDQSIPELDGSDLSSLVDSDPLLSTRLVLMTDLGEANHRTEPAMSAVCASLSKPVHLEDLRRCLRVAAGLEVMDVVVAAGKSEGPVEPVAGLLLLVEDNVINQKVALAMLTSVGYQVDTAPNGAAAVEAVAAQAYDAILMDCQMAEMNGYEATAAIRAMQGAELRTPIIAMTAGARPEDRERCLAAGMDGYLAKPVSKPVLLAKVARFLKPENTPPATRPQVDPASLESQSAGESAVDAAIIAELRALSEDADPDFLPELVSQFVSDTDTRLNLLRGALDAGDTLSAGSIAHSIKGSSGTLGGRRLALSCGRLEKKAIAGHLVAGQGELREVEDEYQELRRTLARELLTPS